MIKKQASENCGCISKRIVHKNNNKTEPDQDLTALRFHLSVLRSNLFK